jgi:hypothetical protein
MMIAEEVRQLAPNRRELRKFGLLVGAVFAALGLVWLARGKGSAPWFLAPGAALMLLGALWPKVLKPVYLVWMSLAIVLGFVVSQVILTLVFFLVFTPLGLVARCAGRDFLKRRLDRSAATYWMPRERPAGRLPAEYERQF